jgi:hypothetical protein
MSADTQVTHKASGHVRPYAVTCGWRTAAS